MPGLTASNMKTKSQILEFEKRWALLAGIATAIAVAAIVGSFGGAAAWVPSVGLADRLAEIQADRSRLVILSIIQFIGWMLLAVPLVYLFKATSSRSNQVRRGLVAVMIVAPLFFGIGGLGTLSPTLDSATEFQNVPQSVISDCVAKKTADSGDEVSSDDRTDFEAECEDEAARDLRTDSSLTPLVSGFLLAGILGMTFAIVYLALWSMRTGLLSRFWGSLGMALGVIFTFAVLIGLPPVLTLIWFIYLGLLFVGWIPGGRPPAWTAGEAIPWPRPGEQLDGEGDLIDGTGEPVGDDVSPTETGSEALGERIKRKKRRQPPE